MRSLLSAAFVNTAIRVVIGGIFIYAGAVKMIDPQSFAAAIKSFHLVPPALVNPLALFLPCLEVMAGTLWLLNRAAVSAATIIFGLCVLFAAVLGTAILRGLPVNCGCFGAALGGSTAKVALARALFFLAATGYWLVTANPPASHCRK